MQPVGNAKMNASIHFAFTASQHLLIATHILVAMRLGDTPVLIPNTMVKT